MALIVMPFGNSRIKQLYKTVPEHNSNRIKRITHRSTGRQKQARFLPVGKLLA